MKKDLIYTKDTPICRVNFSPWLRRSLERYFKEFYKYTTDQIDQIKLSEVAKKVKRTLIIKQRDFGDRQLKELDRILKFARLQMADFSSEKVVREFLES